jgi:hypothetical protein
MKIKEPFFISTDVQSGSDGIQIKAIFVAHG